MLPPSGPTTISPTASTLDKDRTFITGAASAAAKNENSDWATYNQRKHRNHQHNVWGRRAIPKVSYPCKHSSCYRLQY